MPASARSARGWAKSCYSLDISPLPAYERCIELIPRIAWLGMTINHRYRLLSTISDLAAEAAAWAISVQAYNLAIEWLEQGRSVVWNQILQLRAPFDDLSAVDPTLAEQLKDIAFQLEHTGARPMSTTLSNHTSADLEDGAQHHRRLAEMWEQHLEKARSIPGFHNFMHPRKAEELNRSATDGPVVIINTHFTRCDALIISPQCDNITHISLASLSLNTASECWAQLYSSAGHRGDGDRGLVLKQTQTHHGSFRAMLATLWSTIVKPILDAIGCTHKVSNDLLPHVTWCAAGVLAFLPLHAAGPYDGSLPNTFDLVISSYTPTLSALLASNITALTPEFRVLAVGQQHTPNLPSLPGTVQELAEVEKQAKKIGYLQFDDKEATVDEGLRAMDEHDWVHLACHASQNRDNLAHSAFHLHDGNLTLETITKRQFRNKGLASLSACQTATGASELPDEAVHLAAGMMMAGYPSVIATMWPICDADGPEVAGQVYTELLEDGRADHKRSARALHKVVTELRRKIGEGLFERWVPFIHIGV